MKFSLIRDELELKGYWPDFLRIDRLLIENNLCPRCHKRLTYKGFSNPKEYKAYGVCEKCDFARLFWTEKALLALAKKKLSRRAAAKQ